MSEAEAKDEATDVTETDATTKTPDSANLRKRQGRAASPGASPAARAGKSSDDADKAGELKRKASIYALSPDKVWLYANHKWAYMIFSNLAFVFLAACCFFTPTFEHLRLCYTLVALSLLAYRFQLYWKKKWCGFFIELCYVISFFLIASLWICPNGVCSEDWELGVFVVAQGAVAGSTFPLQMGVGLHHPEAFETFFLHNSPMWVCYAIRWRHMLPLPSNTGLGHCVWCGFKVYMLWVMFYWPFLMLQPHLPDIIAGAETLPDGFIYPDVTREERIKKKRGNYKNWAIEASKGLAAHCALSMSGFLAAGMTFQYHKVQVIWIFAVLAGCADVSISFYKRSQDATLPAPSMMVGLKRMGLAWALLIPTYTGCVLLGDTSR